LTVFISHSFDNRPEFENVAEWLEQVDVEYWKPSEIRSASSLRDQLRAAVGRCSVCIFIATRRSVQSSWCGAELGAFWGADIPIIVYLAEASLPEEQLPPIVQGDVWERRLSRVAVRAKELTTLGHARAGVPLSPTARVSSMTAEQLEKVMAGAVSLVIATQSDGAADNTRPDLESMAHNAAGHVLRAADVARHLSTDSERGWQRVVLWVDDRPDNNIHERRVFESLGFSFVLATSTRQALDILEHQTFGAIISDMGRKEGPSEGYRLLEALRTRDTETPFFIYTGSRAPKHVREAVARGAQGVTNIASELIDMVTNGLGTQNSGGNANL
jgi:CheY-like chemotaxis protein